MALKIFFLDYAFTVFTYPSLEEALIGFLGSKFSTQAVFDLGFTDAGKKKKEGKKIQTFVGYVWFEYLSPMLLFSIINPSAHPRSKRAYSKSFFSESCFFFFFLTALRVLLYSLSLYHFSFVLIMNMCLSCLFSSHLYNQNYS